MNATQFHTEFQRIKSLGWVKTKYSGDRGIGSTFEKLLNIEENNSKESDCKCGDIKVSDIASTSLQTLMTCDYRAWQIKTKDVLNNYGYKDEETGLLALRTTFKHTPNNRGFYYDASDDEFLYVKNEDEDGTITIILKWSWNLLNNRFHKKLHGMLKVYAESDIREDGKYFRFVDYSHLQCNNAQKLKQAYQSDSGLYIDIRCSYKYNEKGRVFLKNHGTAFRLPESKLGLIFA